MHGVFEKCTGFLTEVRGAELRKCDVENQEERKQGSAEKREKNLCKSV
jgi:hypothetical protein